MLCWRGCYQEAPLLAAPPEGLGFISYTHIGQLSSGGSDHMTLVACTYLDIDTHTRTKKRDSVFRKANIFVYFVFVRGVCRYTYLCMCRWYRWKMKVSANVLTLSPPYFFSFLRLDLSLTWNSLIV